MRGVLRLNKQEKEIIEWIESAGEHPDYLQTLANFDPQPMDSIKERMYRAFWAAGYMVAVNDLKVKDE